MFRSSLKTALSAVAFTALGSAANAGVVSLQLQESGVPTQTITPGTSFANFTNTFGTFFVSLTGLTNPTAVLPALLDSNAIASSSAAGGTLTLLVTATGVSAPLGTVPFLSGFTENSLSGPVTVRESTFVDPANVAFSMAHPLGSATFSGIGQTSQTTLFGPITGPYSLTEEYVIIATGASTSNSTINVSAVPEPSTWAMMLLGFIGLGFAFRQSRRKVSFA
jgi:hypothetical protein